MLKKTDFYINGKWTAPASSRLLDVINPANEEAYAQISLGSSSDVDKAVAAARLAFETWSRSTRAERITLLQKIVEVYQKHYAEMAETISREMGAPLTLAKNAQAAIGLGHLNEAIRILTDFRFEQVEGSTAILYEPVGVCGLITPWNWPINQIAVKAFPALAAGCTMILKPAQLSPYSAQILAEVIDAAGVPAGVFNLLQGSGSLIGTALSTHPDVDMISFTGSESVGVEIARNAAPTVKRVCQELGGKSPFIVLDDANLAKNVAEATTTMMGNSGQTCSAGSRLLVPSSRMDDAVKAAREAAEGVTVGDPKGNFAMGPVVSKGQYNIIQQYIQKGLDEGAKLIAGGLGRPAGLDRGWYVKPTVFVGSNDMAIAREEIFGPVLVIIGYKDIEQAIEIANDTDFGLAGYVSGADLEQCRAVGRRIRAGWIGINGGFDFHAAFGGYKRSGNGREWGEFGFHEYLEVKSLLGYG